MTNTNNWAANLANNLRTMAKAAKGFYATEQQAAR